MTPVRAYPLRDGRGSSVADIHPERSLLQLNQSTRHWYSTQPRERAQTVRSSRASGKVEEREDSRLLVFDYAALRSGRTERVATRSEEVYEASVV